MIKSAEDKVPPMLNGLFPHHALQGTKAKLPRLFQVFFWVLMASASQAATYTVSGTADSPLVSNMCDGSGTCTTLRAAIRAANATPGADTINLPAGTYTLTITGADEDQGATGDLDITDSVTITGAGVGSTLIDGAALGDRVFQIIQTGTSTVSVTISGVTIQNGHVQGSVGGGIYNKGATLTVDSAIITNNTADNTGSAPTGGNGGGIYNTGTLTVSNSTISGNTADTSNVGNGGGGGGIYNSGLLNIENCAVTGNQTLNGSNTGAGGGGIQNVGVSGVGPNTIQTTIIGSTFSSNSAALGAAVRNQFGRVDIDTSVIENNTAEFSGGGVQNDSGSMHINRTAIRNNIAPQNGAGIENMGAMDIGSTTISGNQALGLSNGTGGAGGGIFNSGAGAVNLFNSTLSGNAALVGGGIYNHKEMLVTNATIYDNSGSSGGSEVYACGSKDESLHLGCDNAIRDADNNLLIHTKFVNTIIGNSSTATNCDGDVADLITSNGYNIETANTCGFTGTGDSTNVSPASLFSSGLQYNGGDIAQLLTFSLLDSTSNPAHNSADYGNCPVIDERGFKRDEGDGKCDIGAYEISTTNTKFAVMDLALDITYKIGTPLNGSVQTTLNFTVSNKGPLPADNIVLTARIPALSWIKITNWGAGSGGGSCSPPSSSSITCTVAHIDAYKTADFFVAVLATQAGSFILDGEVKSDGSDNFRPDNLKSVTVTIPTVAGSNLSGNNFAGTGGGGVLDWLTLIALAVPATRRLRRR